MTRTVVADRDHWITKAFPRGFRFQPCCHVPEAPYNAVLVEHRRDTRELRAPFWRLDTMKRHTDPHYSIAHILIATGKLLAPAGWNSLIMNRMPKNRLSINA